jgi:hypothetical protein
MKRPVALLLFLLTSLCGYAQFTLSGADEYLKQKAEASERQRVQDSLRRAELEEQQWMANDIRYRMKWTNMVTYRKSISFIENSYNVSYYGYTESKQAWTFPISLRLTGAQEYNEGNLKKGYTDWSQHLTDLGMSGFRRIRDCEYFALGLHLPIGWERFRYTSDPPTAKRRWGFLIGLAAEQRLMYISSNKTGLVMSAGFYEQILNSKRYVFDAGFSLEVGIKF